MITFHSLVPLQRGKCSPEEMCLCISGEAHCGSGSRKDRRGVEYSMLGKGTKEVVASSFLQESCMNVIRT